MPSPRAVKVVRRTLASGEVREYHYPRGPRVEREQPARIVAGSVGALIEAWRRSPEWADLADATRANYTIYLRSLAGLEREPAADVRRRHIIALRNAIAVARGNGAATGFVRAASALWAWAIDAELAETSPAARLKPLRHGELAAWPEAALADALAKLPEAYRRVVLLAVYTGQRRGDLIRLSWGQYDGAAIRLRQGKTGATLVVPAHRELRALLDAWRQTATTTTILAAPNGGAWTDRHLSRELGARMRAIGWPGLTLHGLRKLAAVRLAQAGATLHEIAAIGGWKSLSMVQHYTKAADQHALAQAAIVRLENVRVTGKRSKKTGG
jgi:integrase